MCEIVGRYINVRGVRTYYEESGAGQPFLCLPMAGAPAASLHGLVGRLAAPGRRFVCPDLPGRGNTPPPFDTLRPIEDAREYLDFIWAVAETLALARPVLVGSAMTAAAMLLLAAEKGERVRAVVAINGGGRPKSAADPGYIDLLNHPGVNLSDFKEAHLPGMCGPDTPRENLNACIWFAAKTQVADTAVADALIFPRLDLYGRLGSVTAPVLLVRGELDPSADAEVCREILAIPGSEEALIPGGKHYLHFEKPDALAAAIEGFLARQGL